MAKLPVRAQARADPNKQIPATGFSVSGRYFRSTFSRTHYIDVYYDRYINQKTI